MLINKEEHDERTYEIKAMKRERERIKKKIQRVAWNTHITII